MHTKQLTLPARKAEELILTSSIIPDHTCKLSFIVHMKLPATILTQGVTNSSGLTDVKTLIDLNRTFIIKEAVASVQDQFPILCLM